MRLDLKLDLKNEIFKIVDTGSRYILKPQTKNYREVPENEDVTMRLAELIETVTGGQMFVIVTEMILAELPRRISVHLQQAGNGRIFLAHTQISTR